MKGAITATLLTASVGWGQMWGREPRDPRDLAQRMAVSDVVAVGTVIKQHILPGRYPDGGSLYTIRVEEELCRGADFQPGRSSGSFETEVQIFVPGWHGLLLDDPDPVESLPQPGKFLLMLMKDPDSEGIVKEFRLDPSRVYYRAVGRARGAIQIEQSTYKAIPNIEMEYGDATLRLPITPTQPPSSSLEGETRLAEAFLTRAKTICEAVQPDDPAMRIAALERLVKTSPDSAVRDNAAIAISLLRGQPLR
jgi:hypothetical protein